MYSVCVCVCVEVCTVVGCVFVYIVCRDMPRLRDSL